MTTSSARCLLSGASGYVGSRIKRHLSARGWSVTELRRRPAPDVPSIAFSLGDDVDPARLRDHDALVHCAYDFGEVTWEGIRAKNVDGSKRLFDSAHRAGVRRIVYISSISAFEGCRSMYGKAKLETERAARELGSCCIRPGLVFGEKPGAAFGRLMKVIERSSVVPIPGNGRQPMYLVHEQDLAEAVLRCLETTAAPPEVPVTVAHERMWPFRELLREIARRANRRIFIVPVPGTAVWCGLRAAEILRIPTDMRSDSVISLMHQNPTPDLNARALLGLVCHPFA